MSVYLKLFHGRKHPDEELDDWGEDGPVFGPLPFVHTTYGNHIKMGYGHNPESATRLPDYEAVFCELHVIGDLLYYDGMWYGDWAVFDESIFNSGNDESQDLRRRHVLYDEQKCRPIATSSKISLPSP